MIAENIVFILFGNKKVAVAKNDKRLCLFSLF